MSEKIKVDKEKLLKATNLLQELTGVSIGTSDEATVDDLLGSESVSMHSMTQEEAEAAAEDFLGDIAKNGEALGKMTEEGRMSYLEKQANKRIKATKLKKAIKSAAKDMASAEDNKAALGYEKMLNSSMEELATMLDEDEWSDAANELLESLKETGEAGGELTEEEKKTTKKLVKLIDPSKGKALKRIKEATTATEVEYVKAGESQETNAFTEEVTSATEKHEYNDYNSMTVQGVKLTSPEGLFGTLKVPADGTAYLTAPARREATNFIEPTVKEIRKIKNQNVEDKETQLMIGKRINTKDLYRQDGKIWKKVNTPEETESELSIYVALDFSGSTSCGLDKQIASVGVALIESLEKLKIKHTVMAYSNDVSIIKRGTKRTIDKWKLAADGVRGTGGNNEGAVFDLVTHLVGEDKEKDILLVFVTDGDGCGEEAGLKKLHDAHDKDKRITVKSVGLNYDGGSFTLDRAQKIYGMDNAHTVMDRKQFGKIMAKIVKEAIFVKKD